MKILHLSDTTISGAPIRIVDLINKYTPHEARHIVYEPTTGYRAFKTDLVAPLMSNEEIAHWLSWADVIHFHNRWKRQKLFSQRGFAVPKKKAVIQIHSPREIEGFKEEAAAGVPIAVIAQFHVRQWPEAKYVVPNVVDIYGDEYQRIPGRNPRPVVSYAPSNTNQRGWNDKGYGVTAPVLKRLKLAGRIDFQLITGRPHLETLELKRLADIGIDEIVTGSYHLSSLEYMAMGVPCFANLDVETKRVLVNLTGSHELPWLQATPDVLNAGLVKILDEGSWGELGRKSRDWMKEYWSPEFLAGKYLAMYETL